MSYEHLETTHQERRLMLFKIQQGIYLVFGVVEALIAIRFALRLFGANPGAAFAEFIYSITAPFIGPFVGLFGTPEFDRAVFEPHALVAIVVYALLAWLLVRILWLVFGETQTARTTTQRTVETPESEPPPPSTPQS